jgi:hypothetical protein
VLDGFIKFWKDYASRVNQKTEKAAWDRIIGKAQVRFLKGGELYGWDDWAHKDNLQDLEEELLDGIVYLMLTIRKLEYLRQKEM